MSKEKVTSCAIAGPKLKARGRVRAKHVNLHLARCMRAVMLGEMTPRQANVQARLAEAMAKVQIAEIATLSMGGDLEFIASDEDNV